MNTPSQSSPWSLSASVISRGVSAIALCLCAFTASAATVLFPVTDSQLRSLTNAVVFTNSTTPGIASTNLILGTTHRKVPTNGVATAYDLVGGVYTGWLEGRAGNVFRFVVPPDDTNTYTVSQLLYPTVQAPLTYPIGDSRYVRDVDFTNRIELLAAPAGQVIRHIHGGAQVAYRPSADTDAARGLALSNALRAAESDEPLVLGIGTFSIAANATMTNRMSFVAGAVIKPASGVTVTLRGSVDAPEDQQVFDLSAGGSVVFSSAASQKRFPAAWWGSAGDTLSVSSAVAAAFAVTNGTVLIDRLYTITNTITVGGAASDYRNVSIEGGSPVKNGFIWTGATNGTALSISGNKFARITGIGIYDQSSGGGAGWLGTGMLLTGPDEVGTQTLGKQIENVLVQGFGVGIQAGEYTGHAASEITFINVNLNNCRVGFKNQDLNTLNLTFINSGAASCSNGVEITSGNLNWFGGSFGQNTNITFFIANAGAPVTIRGVRDEQSRRFLHHGTVAYSQILVDNCSIISPVDTNYPVIYFNASVAGVSLRNNWIDGQIYIPAHNSVNGYFELTGNNMLGNTNLPFYFSDTPDQGGAGHIFYSSVGNRFYNYSTGDAFQYPSEFGSILGSRRFVAYRVETNGNFTLAPRNSTGFFGDETRAVEVQGVLTMASNLFLPTFPATNNAVIRALGIASDGKVITLTSLTNLPGSGSGSISNLTSGDWIIQTNGANTEMVISNQTTATVFRFGTNGTFYADSLDLLNLLVQNGFFTNSFFGPHTQWQLLVDANGTLQFSNIVSTVIPFQLGTNNTATGTVFYATTDSAYNATTWNGSLRLATENAVRDKFESLSYKSSLQLTHPHRVDGTGATFETTQTTNTFGQAFFSHSADKAANWVEYYLQVPDDLDTSVDLRVKLKVIAMGTDSGTGSYELTSVSVADNTVLESSTLANAITINLPMDATSGKHTATSAWTTLTGWRSALTAGQTWRIRLARDGDSGSDDSTVGSLTFGLVLEYGATQ